MTNQDRGVAMGGWVAVVTGERPWQGGGHAGPRPEELGGCGCQGRMAVLGQTAHSQVGVWSFSQEA